MAMSTASVTTDTTNYIRIHLILMKGGTLLTKTLFLKRVKDLSPAGHELTVDEFLGQHRAKITSTGKTFIEDKLYPMTGTTNLDEWDLPLYCFILMTVCGLPAINKLDMKFLKTMRNELSHLHDPSLTDADFKNHLNIIEPIFTRSLQMINDPLFEQEMKTLLQKCETGALALDEVVKVHHDSNRKHIELLSNQVKMMKNQVDMMKNQSVMLQNQTTHTAKLTEIQYALSLLTDIKNRNQQGTDVAIPDVQVIIEVKNCSVDKETQLLDFLMEQFNRTISSPNCAIATDFPNLAMHKISEAVYDTFRSFLTMGRHVIRVEKGSLLLTIQCDEISSFVSLVRDCIDGSLLMQLKKLTDAVRAWDGCAYVNLDTGVFPDQIIDVICQLASTLNEKIPRRTFALPSLPTIHSETMSESNSLSSPETNTKRSFQSKGHMLRLTIKPETEEHREEIEQNFMSGNIDKGIERIQDQIRKIPDWANAAISAKILTPGRLKTEFGKTQDSGVTVTSKQPSSGQSAQDKESPTTNTPSREDLRHSIESMTSLPSQTKLQSQNKTAGIIDGKSSYMDGHDADIGLLLNEKEENGCDKEQDFKLSKDRNKTIDNERAPPAPVWSKEDFGFKDNKLISSAKQYQKKDTLTASAALSSVWMSLDDKLHDNPIKPIIVQIPSDASPDQVARNTDAMASSLPHTSKQRLALVVHFQFDENVSNAERATRHASTEDDANLQRVIKILGFDLIDCRTFMNVKAHTFDGTFPCFIHQKDENIDVCSCMCCSIRKYNFTNLECFLLVISSHDAQSLVDDEMVQEIEFSDKILVRLDDIIEAFSDSKCKNLKGVPRVIILDVCRSLPHFPRKDLLYDPGHILEYVKSSELYDPGHILEYVKSSETTDLASIIQIMKFESESAEDTDGREKTESGATYVPTAQESSEKQKSRVEPDIDYVFEFPEKTLQNLPNDFLLVFFSYANKKSFHDLKRGSWMIEELTKVVAEHDFIKEPEMNFLTILTKVRGRVALNREEKYGQKQMVIYHRLLKPIIFTKQEGKEHTDNREPASFYEK